MGKPGWRSTATSMSWPDRSPGMSGWGVTREASATRSVSFDQPRPESARPASPPGMKRGPMTIGKTNW